MRLIDADAMRAEWGMGEFCEECKRDVRQCASDYCFTRMDVCGMIDDAPTVNGWISVNDRLPSPYHMVLITGRNSVGGSFGVIKGSYDGDEAGWYRDDVAQYANSREDVITHWMPLPEPPKEGEHET